MWTSRSEPLNNPMSTTQPIRAVLFDLDNTLLQRDDAMRAYLLHTWEPSAQELEEWLALDNHGRGPRAPLCRAIERARALNGDVIWEHMRTHISAFVTPDVELMRALRALNQRVPTGILSNGSGGNQRAKLARSGLAALFDEARVWISGELGVSKPHSEAFAPALESFKSLGIWPEHVVMVGDDPVRDILPARSAGMATVWVRHDEDWAYEPEPDRCVRGLPGVTSWIREITS